MVYPLTLIMRSRGGALQSLEMINISLYQGYEDEIKNKSLLGLG
jgi:hypothetical protein